jgi:hypothetical protein
MREGAVMEYQYIVMMLVYQKPRTKVWDVLNKASGNKIGRIGWYGPWHQYCFLPMPNTVFSKGCMTDIIDFITHAKERS